MIERLPYIAIGAVFCLTLSVPVNPTQAAVLDQVQVMTEHPWFNAIMLETSPAFTNYRLIPSTTRSNYFEISLYGVTPGKVEDRIPIADGGIESISVNYNRGSRETRLGVTLSPGVSANDVLPVRLDDTRYGRMAVVIELPQSLRKSLPDKSEVRRFKDEGKRIVIVDPGHGWFDSGASYYGMQEKTIVLDIAQKLVSLINKSGNMHAFLTRDGDYLPILRKEDFSGTQDQIRRKSLEARVQIARELGGDIFVSLHLNATSNRRSNARGFEIYYLDENRANQVANAEMEELNLQDLKDYGTDVDTTLNSDEAKAFLIGMKGEILLRESHLLGQMVANNLKDVPGLIPRPKTLQGHRFVVLKHFAMPSVLVEMAFLSNRNDATMLKRTDFRWRLAQSIYDGIGDYFQAQPAAFPSSPLIVSKPFVPAKVETPMEQFPIHNVEKNESLYSIAQKYGTTPEFLKEINNLKKSIIFPGQELKVPVGSQTMDKTYVVRAGDTLGSIADQYDMSLSELKRLNGLHSNRIHPGTELVVSGQGRQSTIDTSTATASADNTNISEPAPISQVVERPSRTTTSTNRIQHYRVRRGDSLYKIAKRYNTSIDDIRRLNGLKRDELKINQKLRIR